MDKELLLRVKIALENKFTTKDIEDGYKRQLMFFDGDEILLNEKIVEILEQYDQTQSAQISHIGTGAVIEADDVKFDVTKHLEIIDRFGKNIRDRLIALLDLPTASPIGFNGWNVPRL